MKVRLKPEMKEETAVHRRSRKLCQGSRVCLLILHRQVCRIKEALQRFNKEYLGSKGKALATKNKPEKRCLWRDILMLNTVASNRLHCSMQRSKQQTQLWLYPAIRKTRVLSRMILVRKDALRCRKVGKVW